ncbi:ATP-binding protein [Actinoplanes utahensis]|uniref:Sensor-like histidine kinase SenX3 n=1 Tax=Actinoplanes utahensis TaxID=1869 RepID=A0A0A6UJT4_ACTUT|nr:ATP-binding protein [Actinoplanes utahensis]KHD75303.1 histidine kinase [Actinoplanes utahensis]GIF30436.1 hypothetical protein Aut01nite_34220 [Actinoplanes utahensis]
MRVQRRLNVGFSALFVLFVMLLLVQFGAGSRLRAEHDRWAARAARAELANERVMQGMTDAETGIRGFLLTGDTAFLEPYRTAWATVAAALDEVAASTDDPAAEKLLADQRAAIHRWLDRYAVPIAADQRPAANPLRDAEGKQLFDDLRRVNDALSTALVAEQRAMLDTVAGERRALDIAAALLVTAILAVGYIVARTGRRKLLAPLEQLGTTIRRLAGGDRTARAEPVEAAELSTVVDALNDLAAQTEMLLAAEQARTTRAGLRQAVAAAMQDLSGPAGAGRRIAALIGEAVGATAVHIETVVPGAGPVRVHWPDAAPGLPADLLTDLLAGDPGRPRILDGGAITLAVCADSDCGPGYLYVSRPGSADWTDAEQRLLTGVAQEIERALRQHSLQSHQSRLITELRMLDERKDTFIQTVTHELRTPLTSILGYTEMITDEDAGEGLNPIQKRALNAILRNAHRLQDTIGDLVLLDRPDNGAAVHAETLDLAALAATVRHDLSNAARAKDLDVTFDADEGWVHGDRTQLQRALRKLMDNAIKFTPPGGSVVCRMTADPRAVTVSVTDTGIGIPAEDVAGLFTPFHRAGNAMDQAVQGPGLGLAIVRDIVRDHGGTIAVQSVVGRGSTFTLTLPAVPVPARSPAPV